MISRSEGRSFGSARCYRLPGHRIRARFFNVYSLGLSTKRRGCEQPSRLEAVHHDDETPTYNHIKDRIYKIKAVITRIECTREADNDSSQLVRLLGEGQRIDRVCRVWFSPGYAFTAVTW